MLEFLLLKILIFFIFYCRILNINRYMVFQSSHKHVTSIVLQPFKRFLFKNKEFEKFETIISLWIIQFSTKWVFINFLA